MLGEKIGDVKGKTTSQRVLPGPTGHLIESSYQGIGKMLGIEVRDLGTYTATMRSDGTLQGEGRGVWMGKNGEMAQWTGQGCGVFQKDGSIVWRGSLVVSSPSDAWARLNQCAGAFEWKVDVEGNGVGSLHEWK